MYSSVLQDLMRSPGAVRLLEQLAVWIHVLMQLLPQFPCYKVLRVVKSPAPEAAATMHESEGKGGGGGGAQQPQSWGKKCT